MTPARRRAALRPSPSLFPMRLVLAAAAALLALPPPADAQVRPLGFGVKAGPLPQFGFDIHVSPRVGLRLLGSVNDDFDGVATAALPIRFPSAGRTAVYVGPSVTFVDYEDVAFAGALIGAEYDLADRVSLFGEIGLDVGVDEQYADFTTSLNTGVGAFYRF